MDNSSCARLLIRRSGVQIPPGPFNLKCSSLRSPESSVYCLDIYNLKEKYRREVGKIKDWSTTADNKKLFLDFLDRRESEGIGVVQRIKYIDSVRTLVRFNGKDFFSFAEKDLQDFVLSMDNFSPKTRHIKWYCVKKFFEFLGKKDLYINFKPRFVKKKIKLPEELLTQEEVNQMIQKARTIRDKALIAVLYESGCRIGELLTRKIKHMMFDKYGGALIVDGKTGQRRVRLIQSVPLLANYISNHPHGNPESYLWISLNNYTTPIMHRVIMKMLDEAAKRAGIKKHVHPHLFRHSRATHLANKLTEQQLKVYFGWTNASEMASVYVHLSGRDVDDAILKLNGIEIDSKECNTIAQETIACFRCSAKVHISSKICSKCGMILSEKEAFEMKDANDKDFQSFLMEMYNKWKNNKQS